MDGRRNRAERRVRALSPQSSRGRAPSSPRTAAILGSIFVYDASCARWCAAHCASLLRLRTGVRCECSLLSCSSARPDSGRRWSGSYESPCFPYSRCSWCRSQGAESAQPRSPPAARARRADDAERARRAVIVRRAGCGCVGVFVCGRFRLRVESGVQSGGDVGLIRCVHRMLRTVVYGMSRSGRGGDRDRSSRTSRAV